MILPSPTAPLGSVRHAISWTPDDIPSGSAVLCRTNAPLVSTAFQLLRASRPCYILGRDVAQQLITQVKTFKSPDLPALRVAIRSWCEKETTKFLSSNRVARAASVRDRADCLLLFANKAQFGPTEVPLLIEKLFTVQPNGIVLSTIHKAKGLEWTNVFILDQFLIGKFASNAWQRQQEINLHYVAATRAKENLTYINSDDFIYEN
jgi:hypothetical protein